MGLAMDRLAEHYGLSRAPGENDALLYQRLIAIYNDQSSVMTRERAYDVVFTLDRVRAVQVVGITNKLEVQIAGKLWTSRRLLGKVRRMLESELPIGTDLRVTKLRD